MDKKKLLLLSGSALVVVIIDQISKYLVRTTPVLQHMEVIPGWLSFNYTQNPGMALGMNWASTEVISVVAILATIGIFIYIIRNLEKANTWYLLCMGLVLGGALGNIVDRLIMARLESYGGVLQGHVVDFIHFTPTIGDFPVFPYIFNVADMAISIAIITLLVFNRRILPDEEPDIEASPEADSGIANDDSQVASLGGEGSKERPETEL